MPDAASTASYMSLKNTVSLRNGLFRSLKEYNLPYAHLRAGIAQKKMYILTSLAHILTLAMICTEYSLAALQNITVDDAYLGGSEGISLIYLPRKSWDIGNTCTGCFAQPDPTQVFDNTWHDASSMHGDSLQRSIGFNFTGVAVYAYFILTNNLTISALTALTITMDGEEAGTFTHVPSQNGTYEYNVLVFSDSNLQSAPHALNISTTGADSSLMLFDYFNYTVDIDLADETPNKSTTTRPTTTSISGNMPFSSILSSGQPVTTDTSSKVSTKISLSRALIGGLVAAIIVPLSIVLLLLFLLFRRGRESSLFQIFRRHHRNDSPMQAIGDGTIFDLLPPYTPENDPPNPVEHIMPIPAVKGRPLLMGETQQRIEEPRTDVGQHCSSSSINALQTSDSVSRARGPVASDHRIMKQIIALRAQIQQLDEQLTS